MVKKKVLMLDQIRIVKVPFPFSNNNGIHLSYNIVKETNTHTVNNNNNESHCLRITEKENFSYYIA